MLAHSILLAASLSFLVPQSTKSVSVFHPPIDAVSVELSSPEDRATIRGWDGREWTRWFPLTIEEEFDPMLRESNLVIFPRAVERIEIHTLSSLILHPLRIPKDPVQTLVASRLPPYPLPFGLELRAERQPLPRRILSREEWGADESFLLVGAETSRSDVAPEHAVDAVENGNGIVPERLRECEEWQRKYPGEFRAERTVREDAAGQRYRWPLQYSSSVKLLVVHHTAQNVRGDERSSLERVRALYAYHANSRGWGDIGYHYLIDERGQIYEGRAGGTGVIGGHAYCWNTGTLSIALLGNFDIEEPQQAQMQSLQSLLVDLARTYDINLGSSVRMHGKNFPPIVGHKDLLSTDCPGYYVRETLTQVRENVWKGNLLATIRFPRPLLSHRTALSPQTSLSALVPRASEPLLTPIGITQLQGRPGSLLPLSLQYRNGKRSLPQFAALAEVTADPGIYLWQERGKRFVPIRGQLQSSTALPAEEIIALRLKVQFPTSPGEYRLKIGTIQYALLVAGKRAVMKPQPTSVPLPQMTNKNILLDAVSPPQRCHTEPCPFDKAQGKLRATPRDSSTELTMTRGVPVQTSNGAKIRIRLTFADDTAVILLPNNALVNGIRPQGREILLFRDTEHCIAKERNITLASGIIRIEGNSPSAITDGQMLRRYSGIIECRSIDGELVLINELRLENYLLGLAEEPDSEPFEKQKAFAIAARSYAAHYMNNGNRLGSSAVHATGHRKFPGLPYDGSDDPRIFQAYEGLTFAERNSHWVRAVQDTAGKILTKNNDILRAAYFSSDDGRTRSPEEAGWSNFPHTEVFTSKPDPWCTGKPKAGHGVGMSGCGARGQAEEGKTAEEILQYYYPGAVVQERGTRNEH